ncbi:MAG: hypothetical protein KDG44_06290, partial [Burkholderiaceae bacterium]|jgi:hypothetical protein|nr:hypothetical protein [Burkholderiaceae bacterium]
MSDGPYRSLPMSRDWKRLAEFSENENFGRADTCAAATRALESTWRNEVPVMVVKGIRGVFLEPKPSLFADAQITSMQALLEESAGYGFGRLFTDHAVAVLNEGMCGEAGLAEATRRALDAYSARAARQIEEHYCRKATVRLTRQVRERIAQAISAADFHALARHCAGLDRGTIRSGSFKHTEIDDGVPL